MTVAIAAGGFLETIEHEVSGLHFDAPNAHSLRSALRRAETHDWDRDALRARADEFSERSFAARFQALVAEVSGG